MTDDEILDGFIIELMKCAKIYWANLRKNFSPEDPRLILSKSNTDRVSISVYTWFLCIKSLYENGGLQPCIYRMQLETFATLFLHDELPYLKDLPILHLTEIADQINFHL